MQHLARRESDPSYLRSIIQQKQIIIEQQQRKSTLLLQQAHTLTIKLSQLQTQLKTQQNAAHNQILNLNLAIREQQTEMEGMKHDKSEYEFRINMLKGQLVAQEKESKAEKEGMKIEFQAQRNQMQLKLVKLEKNLATLHSHYHLEEGIHHDKRKLIVDANRDLRGFSNEKQQRMIMIQNQQYANEIEFQAKEIENLLQKNEKMQEEMRTMKSQLELHKEIENDLVKRSSLAQKLIRQLNKRIRELEGELIVQASRAKVNESNVRSVNQSQDSSRISSSKMSASKDIEEELNKLRFDYANLKNHSLYLQNMQKMYTQKYETLAAIMAEYLENLLYFKDKKESKNQQQDTLQTAKEVNLDLAALRKKDVKEWKTEELETVMFLILNQVRPFLSKTSLVQFPETRNISISFTEAQNKESVTLPKIAQNYQKTYDKQASKINNRFKDIPLDISTKILRSNLREWGTKVSYGSNIPSLAKARKLKSKSIAGDIDRSGFL